MTVDRQVSVITIYDHKNRLEVPRRLVWDGEVVLLERAKLGRHSRVGSTIYLHFLATDATRQFELKVSTESHQWTLASVSSRR